MKLTSDIIYKCLKNFRYELTKEQLEQEKIQLDYQVNWLKANSDKTYKERQMDIEEKRTEVEIMQLRDGNPYNDKIKDM